MRIRHFFFRCFLASGTLLLPSTASAGTFHYDPLTGMVALDTASSPSGALGVYQWSIESGPIQFRNENFIRLSNSVFFFNEPDMISDRSDSQPFDGYFALGKVLPTGIDEASWHTLINLQSDIYTSNLFFDPLFLGGPVFSSYGLLDRPFDNANSLLDLETIPWAETAEMRYDPATGELTLDTSAATSGYISSFAMEAVRPVFDGTAFISPVSDGVISFANLDLLAVVTDVIDPGTYSLGDIMEVGLSQEEFMNLFDEAGFNTRAMTESGRFDLIVEDVAI